MRRLSPIAAAVVAGLTLTSCASPQTGSFDNPADKTPGIVEEAFDDLVSRPILQFEGAVDEINGSGEPSTMQVNVVESGVSFGTAEIAGVECEIMSVDGVYYVKAPKEFWIDQGVDKSHAKKIDNEWTQVDPAVWFDPGAALTAEQYAASLKKVLAEVGAIDQALPEPVDVAGIPAHPIPVGDGFVYISVDSPHTVVKVEEVEVNVEGSNVTLSTDVAGTGVEQAEELLKELTDAIDDLSAVFDDGADLQLSESGTDFKCDNSTFKCKFSVEVATSLNGDYHKADEVKVTLKAEADGGKLGTKKCDKSKTVDVGKTAKLSCSVKFSVPADGVTYDIQPDWSVTGVATFTPDSKAISEKLEADFAAILDELA